MGVCLLVTLAAVIVAMVCVKRNRDLRQKHEEPEPVAAPELSQSGVSEETVLAIASEISRMENNLCRMQDVPGHKQLSRALDRMKVALQAEGYTVIPLLGTPYREGMQMTALFVLDESLPPGSSVITSVQKPQVNRNGKMIQAASVTVGQNN